MFTQVDYRDFSWDQDQATVEEGTGFGLSTIEDAYEEASQRAGSLSLGWRLRSRTFGWQGHVSASTAAAYIALRQEMYYYLVPETIEGHDMTFTLLDGSTRIIPYVRVLDAPIELPGDEPSILNNTYQFSFRTDYPYFLGEETDESQGKTELTGGAVAIPAPVAAPLAMAFGSGSPSDPLSVTNAGNAPAFPVFTITGPGTDFTVTNATTGETFTIATTLTASQSIVIDTWLKTVTRNDGSSLRGDFEGDWITIPGGPTGNSNTIQFSIISGDDVNTALQTVFRDTYYTL